MPSLSKCSWFAIRRRRFSLCPGSTPIRSISTRTAWGTPATRIGTATPCPTTTTPIRLLELTGDLGPGELIESIRIRRRPRRLFNFEKVSKRTYLDIASVNTALSIVTEDGVITDARLTAGGVAPIPLALVETESLLIGQRPDAETAWAAARCAAAEATPIDDVRGTARRRGGPGPSCGGAVSDALPRAGGSRGRSPPETHR